MSRPRAPDWFWLGALALVVVAVVYNLFIADEGETPSETLDGYIERWPWQSPAIVTVARHLANDIDPRLTSSISDLSSHARPHTAANPT